MELLCTSEFELIFQGRLRPRVKVFPLGCTGKFSVAKQDFFFPTRTHLRPISLLCLPRVSVFLFLECCCMESSAQFTLKLYGLVDFQGKPLFLPLIPSAYHVCKRLSHRFVPLSYSNSFLLNLVL